MILQDHEPAGPGEHALLRDHVLDRDALRLQRGHRVGPGVARHQLAAGQPLLHRGRIGPVAAQQRPLLDQQGLHARELVVGHREGIGDAGDQCGDDHGIDGVVHAEPARVLRIEEDLPALRRRVGVLRRQIGPEQHRGGAPLQREEPDAFGVGAFRDRLQLGKHVRVVRHARRIERLEQPGAPPAADRVLAGVRDVRREAGAHPLQPLLLLAHQRDLGNAAVLGDIGRHRLRHVPAGPGQVGDVTGSAREARQQRQRDERESGGAQEGAAGGVHGCGDSAVRQRCH